MTHQGLLLTSTQWAQLSELFGNNYLKKLKGKLLWLASDWEAALWYIQTVKCVDAQHTHTWATTKKQNKRKQYPKRKKNIIRYYLLIWHSHFLTAVTINQVQRETKGGQMCFTCKSFCTHRECPFLEDRWRAFLPESDKCINQKVHSQSRVYIFSTKFSPYDCASLRACLEVYPIRHCEFQSYCVNQETICESQLDVNYVALSKQRTCTVRDFISNNGSPRKND